jgi:ribA/ribD-fused uncharacterized protein
MEGASRPVEYATAEHLFQASKTEDPGWQKRIAEAFTPAAAKTLGRCAPLRPYWENDKFGVMHDVLKAKFNQNQDLGRRLAATAPEPLMEGNTWHDQTWGDCTCPEHAAIPGLNALGVILMRVRLDWLT